MAASRTAADLAILGAGVRTLDPERPRATAVAMRDGVIVAVGSDAEVREACDARTELLDGAGVALVPGLTDSHQHPIWGTQITSGVDLGGLRTLDEVRAALAAEARRAGPGAWVRGWNLEYAVFAGRPIDGRVLAGAVGGAPMLATFFDLHTGVATPAALAAAGITDAPPAFADGSEVVFRDGEATGELLEMSAYRFVLDAVPSPGPAAERAAVVATLRRLTAMGLTGVHAMDGSPETLDTLRDLEGAGELSVRIVAPLWQQPHFTDEAMQAQLHLAGERGRRWRGGVAKFFIDGVIDTGTAWLLEPDTHGDGTAPFWPEPERYAAAVARFARAGFQCVTHAVGDRAVVAALDAYAAAGRHGSARHRIEHLESIPDDVVRRVAAADVTASMQPLHMQWREGDGSDSWAERLGPERAGRAFRVRDLLEAGARLALGSDWPVASADPREGLAWARLRRTPGRPDAPVFEPGQRLSGLEALEGYTTWAADAVGEARLGGRIVPGLRADLTGFAVDPVDCDPDELPALPVRLTVVDGEVVFDAARSATAA